MRFFRSAGLLAVAAAFAAAPALAQSSSSYLGQKGIDERFRLDIGGFFQSFDTTLSVSNAAGTAGTSINIEDDLGQDSSQTNFAADGYWRFGRHGRLDFAYRGWNRSNETTLARDIVVGDTTYRVGAQVDSALRAHIAELYYSYSFINNGGLEFGAGLGLSAYFNDFEITGSGSISGGGTGGSGVRTTEARSYVAPIPALKLYFAYTLFPKVFLRASFKGITGTVEGYHGEMADFRGGVDWLISNNVGVGAMYQYTQIQFSHADDVKALTLDYNYSGPLAYLILAF